MNECFPDSNGRLAAVETGCTGVVADIGYEFAAAANNGRIVSRTNYQRGVVDGEKVSYLYDALNRLVEAKGTTKNSGGTTVNTWGQDFGYDGFGNLLSQAPKIGYPDASSNVLLTVNAANNRISSTNWVHDGNGNTTRMPVVGGGYADLAYDVKPALMVGLANAETTFGNRTSWGPFNIFNIHSRSARGATSYGEIISIGTWLNSRVYLSPSSRPGSPYDNAGDLYCFSEATASWREGYANLNKVVERLGFVPGDLRYPCSNRTEEVSPFWY